MLISLIKYVVFLVISGDPPNFKDYVLAEIQKHIAKTSVYLFIKYNLSLSTVEEINILFQVQYK